ncbi:aminotransferase class I/II-fold pyridoxal phosphate-dependent enzyme [Paludifilum halophilum]|uniref:Histidinol-phosphate aminotransferase n=1 Tax=Paludifilum halophilum TaxID=1642702 RepID=A0A235B557_9BACL|nr:aminotransferase class I/II-fold pyridoxal phosphate-dependent enzyme [Paludifilum halophilum]OYD06745.1 histidinol-phosphate aminotransferase [Paludifilum halophilum]
MPSRPPFSDIVSSLPATVPFVPPEESERRTGQKIQLRLGANESSFGMSPRAAEAMRHAVEEAHLYGDAHCHELRTELARHHGVETEHIVFGSGIDELLGLICRVFLNPGDPITTSLGGYPTFNYHVKGFGGQLHQVPYDGDRNDLKGLADKARQTGSRILYLANPDNPTGTFYTAEELKCFRRQLPEGCLLLLDEAYVEFAPEEDVMPFDPADPQIIRTRTFSKAHGMAGARIAYAITHPETVDAVNKIRNHFGINRIAQAGALASLRDPGFIRSVAEKVAQGREEYASLARELGFRPIPSSTNFVAIDVGSAKRAQAIMDALWEEGVFVRVPGVEPLNRCIRVGVGTPEERRQFAEAFREAARRTGIDG